MAVTRIGYVTAQNLDGDQDTILTPTGTIAEGDWMVMVLSMNQSQILTVPTGWTAVYNSKVAGTLSTAVFIKKRASTDGSYTFHVSTGTLVSSALMWFRGVADTGWILPANGRLRNTTGSTYNNIADPITTTVPNTLALTISTERTIATESHFTSMTGATEWFYVGQSGSSYETIAIGYADRPTAGATDPVTIAYPNTQASNGWAVQLGLPAAATPPPPMPQLRLWNGTAEVGLTAHSWNGNTESASLTNTQPYNGKWVLSDLLSTTPFYIAHRGGGMNWPEHTMRSYSSAANYGMKAIEISCHITSDGYIVCHHDASTLRMTGTDINIGASTLAQVQALTNTAAYTDNPSQDRQPIPLLSDVLDRYAQSHVLFIEPKVGGSWQLNTLMPLIQSKNDVPARIVWKQPINSGQWANAKARGWATWGYVLSQDPTHTSNLDTLIPQANVDYIGVERIASDAFVSDIVARATAVGKKVIMWEIRSIADRDRAIALGCVGMMTSNLWAVLPKFP
jgi:glycerophosphoryl diester phosphodiesterase